MLEYKLVQIFNRRIRTDLLKKGRKADAEKPYENTVRSACNTIKMPPEGGIQLIRIGTQCFVVLQRYKKYALNRVGLF